MAEYAPQAIRDLFDQIKAAFPSAIMSGIIGDQAHTYGYHRGRHYVNAGDYSVQYGPEDTTGDGEAACGLDISYGNAADHYLVTQRMLDAVGNPAMDLCREYYGSTNGWDVVGYDYTEGHPASSDPSHCWHGHWSFRRLTATTSLRAVGDVITGTTTGEDDMFEEADRNLLRETYNRTIWIDDRTKSVDPVQRDTFNLANWINDWRAEVDEKLAELSRQIAELSSGGD